MSSIFGETRIAVHIDKHACKALRNEHQWVYDRSITKQNKTGNSGDLAVLFDAKRQYVGVGIYDPDSPLRVRALTLRKETVNDDWLASQFQRAAGIRASLFSDAKTSGFRLLHGENDNLPGIVVDLYATVAVLRLDTAAWLPHIALLAELIRSTCAGYGLTLTGIVLRLSRNSQRSTELEDGTVIWGAADGNVIFSENGINFICDPLHGQKTGFFLDQRENRARVETIAEGKSVLNMFAYNGGFSLYALRGGADRVVSVDLAKPAIDAIDDNLACNPNTLAGASKRHEGIAADAFAYFDQQHKAGNLFDIVIIDPPAFAQKEADIEQGLRAYRKLAKAAARLVVPGGTLVAASCSSRISMDEFRNATLQGLRDLHRKKTSEHSFGHALDHPVGFIFGNYLKCIFFTLE